MKFHNSIAIKLFIICICTFFSSQLTYAQVSGNVFRDFNANGTKDATTTNTETFLAGVVVKAFNASDAPLTVAYGGGGSSTNAALGTYTVTGGTLGQIRLEFIMPANDVYATNGAAGGTTVMFPTGATQNLAVSINGEYVQADPSVLTTNFFSQNSGATPNASHFRAPLSYTTDPDGNTLGTTTGNGTTPFGVVTYTPVRPSPITVATHAALGSTWGVAYDRRTKKLYSSAYVKRGVRLGGTVTESTGAIFVTTDAITPVAPSLYIDLNTVFGANTAGVNPHPFSSTTWASDLNTITPVGKVGLGDIDISKDGRFLYVVNLADRNLYVIPTSGALNTTTIVRYPIPTTGLPVVTDAAGTAGTAVAADIRPFGLGIDRNGDLFVGAVNSCESISAGAEAVTNNASFQMRMYVWKFVAGTFTLVLNNTLRYNRDNKTGYTTFDDGGNTTYSTDWEPWSNTDASSNQQAMLTNITFFDDKMVLGFRDRGGDQAYSPGSDGGFLSSGDTYIAAPSGANYVLESAGGVTGLFSTRTTNNEGPGGGEFFEDTQGDYITNSGIGGIYYLPGYGLVSTTTDAVVRRSNGTFLENAGAAGVQVYNITNGNYKSGYDFYYGNLAGSFAKASGLGDLEILVDVAPIEIGNRVWNDANNDGIQEPGEAGINNVTLELFADFNNDGIPDGAALATTTTNVLGEWYFNNSNITDGDPNTAGNQVGLKPNSGYIVRPAASSWASGAGVGSLAGLQLTKTDKIGNGTLDLSDNDASLTTGVNPIPQIRIVAGDYGQNNHSYDLGFNPLASIGDRVWRDDDKDGIQDAGEPGVAGVTVTLYQNGADGNPGTADDIVIGTTVTDAYGNYLFDNLTPTGSAPTRYNVGFTLPTNYQFTTQTNTQAANGNTTNTSGGATAANGSDANVTTGRTGSWDLSAGEAERGADAGIIFNTPPITQSVGDRVWLDNGAGANAGNGIQDAGEPGVAGVTVTLYNGAGVAIATIITDVNGNYLFTNVPVGTGYTVGFTPPAGFIFTAKDAGGNDATDSDVNTTAGATFGRTDAFNVASGQNITTVDAGLIAQSTTKASLGDRVWYDNNRDGVQDVGEPGIAGVTVQLLDINNVVLATTTTDAFGNYIFPNLDPGGYRVVFAAVAGLQRTAGNSTSGNIPDATDSDADQTTGRTQGYVLVAGEKNMSVDAGYYSTQPAANVGALGNFVWNDLNGDGIQDAGEPGIAGVTVTLYNSAGAAIATTTTDANGNYLFTNLTPGNYSVGFSNLPTGFSFTGQDKGGSDAIDSDANPATGRTAQVAVVGGATNSSLDAGLRQGSPSGLGSLGNRIWWDLDGDNVQDDGEPGVSGVTVTLLDYGPDGVLGGGDDGASRTTTTNALGEYIFTGLPAGNYAVQFGTGSTLPAGATAVTPNSGTDDTIDSDGAAITGGTSTTAVYALASGEDNLTVDLGIRNTAKGSFGNRVWYDNGLGGGTANNGIQDGTEIGVAGVIVTLVNAAGQPVDRTGAVTTTPITTTTDANGYYSFADLTAGATFAARFSNTPAGFDFTSKVGVGSGDDNRSDADIVLGLTPAVTIVANTHNTTLDAGLVGTRAALGNFVWSDLNNNGTQDTGEPGVAGVTVTLFRPGFGLDGIAGNADDALPVASMITDGSGAYFFGNLIPGDYQVEFTTIPTGMIFTQQNTPGDNQNNTNSDAVPANANGRTGTITLSAGEVDLTIDAGLTVPRPATIGNKVFADFDTDGIQDTNEPGIAGVLVTLYNSSNQPIGTAVTDGNGNWQITNVPTGTGYYVIFTPNLPAFDVSGAPGTNPAWTAQNQGGAIATQSLDSGTESDVDSDVTPSGANAGRTGTFNIIPGNNFPNIDAGIINWPAQNILPIRLTSFVANPKANTVELTWVVSTETNVANYEIEYSVNGTSFASIGSKVATGSRTYNLVHNTPKQGLNYYRLKIIDKDGKVSYSEVRTVNFGATSSNVRLYPIPAKDAINITVTGSMINQPATISILSIDGRLMYQQSTTALSQTETINVTKLANGKYIVRMVTPTETINKQIEIIK